MFSAAVYIFFAAVVLAVRWASRALRRANPALPPGPKGLPLLGNLLDMPSEQEWLTFSRWGEVWGASVTSDA